MRPNLSANGGGVFFSVENGVGICSDKLGWRKVSKFQRNIFQHVLASSGNRSSAVLFQVFCNVIIHKLMDCVVQRRNVRRPCAFWCRGSFRLPNGHRLMQLHLGPRPNRLLLHFSTYLEPARPCFFVTIAHQPQAIAPFN